MDKINFQRKSAGLACRRFKGTHSFHRLSEILFEINDHYDLLENDKIIGTVTNNGSNFVEAFNTFGQQHDDSDNDKDEVMASIN
ncbi:hypothetical protein TKK_0010180 [Trichogramma kaykai]